MATLKSSATGLTDLGGCPAKPNPPTITKSFSPSTVSAPTATSTLTLTVGNTNLAPLYLQSALTDALPTSPSAMTIANPNNLGGTCPAANVTATAGSGSVTLAAGTRVPAGGCTITITVQVSTYGSFLNTVAAGALDTTGGASPIAASDTLVNLPPPTLTLSKTIAAPGRVNTSDQFTVQVKNGATIVASASTTGTGTSASTPTTTLISGTTYTLTEVMAAGSASSLSSYTTALTCTNARTGSTTPLPTGTGVSFTITPAAGDVLSCTLTNTPVTYSLSGQVFEDYNYGGGAGRAYNAVQGMALRPGVQVELYSGTTLLSSTLTNGSGVYTFAALFPRAYSVRAVNSYVTSSRAGGCTPSTVVGTPPAGCTQLPVQTYVNGDVNRVGGETPAAADAASGTLTGAQSVTAVTLSTASVNTVDFGFNFDTVVNKNASGQGSLSQFIINADALGNTGLAQLGSRQSAGVNQALPAGVETSIFMASDGTARPGLRAGLGSQLTNGVLVIDQSTGALPDVTGANSASTSIDGTTQTVNVGNTNTGLLGTGGAVGYLSTLTLNQVQRPEVELVGAATVATGVNLLSNNNQVRGLAIRGFGSGPNSAGQANMHIGNDYTGTLIEQNFLGFAATGAMCSNVTTVASGRGDNIRSDGGDTGTVQNNLMSCAGGKGFGVESGSAGWQILGNEIRANAIGNPSLDGIDLENAGSGTATVKGNLITQNGGVGVDGYQGGGSNTIVQNSIVGNGFGQGSAPGETPGVRLYSPGNTVKNNLIASNYGAGVMVTGGVSGNLISQNSIYNNGTLPAANGAAASGQIGIDLLLTGDSVTTGAQQTATTPPFVTKNDNGDIDTGGNDLLNFPVFQSAVVQGGNLVVSGYARPGSTVELFIASPDPSGFGEGQTYLFTGKEGSAADTDAGTGTYTSTPGTDNTNRFQFTLPLPAGVALGTPLTATASCLASDCVGTPVTSNSTSEFSYNILVQAAPVANNDSASTNPLVPITFSVTGNDTPGASIDPTTVIFDPSSTGTVSPGGKTLTAPEGTYVANNDGTVTFTPAATFTNASASSAKYTVKDVNGVVSNVATITLSVPANVDLGIVKTGPAYFKPGDTVTYTLKITSAGSAPAGIKVTDTLPAGLSSVSADNGGVVSGTTVTWTLPATTPVTLTVTGVAPTAAADGSYSGATSLTNTATVASTSAAQAESGGAASNNTSATTAQLVYPRLSKRVRNLTTGGAFGTAGSGKPSEALEYCIDFMNYGVAVNSFIVNDVVPANTSANFDGYGPGLGIQINRATTSTRTSASDGDGAGLSTLALNANLGTLAAGESGSVCFQASIK